MKIERIVFENRSGQKLAARLDHPLGQRIVAFAVFAHCFTCSKNLSAVAHISRALASRGIGVLRFDFTGLGQSEGEFADTNFSTNIRDLVDAADYLAREHRPPKILIGHSLGGAAVLAAAKEIESVEAIATIGAPFQPSHVTHLFGERTEEIETKGEAKVDIGGRPFTVKRQFLEDVAATNTVAYIGKFRKALLILHSPQDNIVGIENAANIYQAAKHPKSFISLDGADHLLTDKQDSIYVGEVISTWVKRYVDRQQESLPDTDRQVVSRTGAKGYTTDLKIREHVLVADEPESVGGADLGPTPYDFLLSGLGACTGMTLRMYADFKKWDLKEVRVHLSHSKIHKDDCEACDAKASKIDRIERVLEVEGDLTDPQRQRLLEIADKCPVHRTLHSDIRIDTRLGTLR